MWNRATAAAVLSGTITASCLAQPEYECVEVDAFASTYNLRETYLWDVSEAGMAPGLTTIATALPGGSVSIGYTGFYWSPAGKVAIPLPDPRAANDVGLLAGGGFVYDTVSQQFTAMPALGGWTNINLHGLNKAGVAVGWVVTCNCSNSQQLNQIPYIWDAAHGARTLNIVGAREVLRVNNSGLVVGNIRGNGSEGFVHDLSTGATTTMNAFLAPNSSSQMVDISDQGVALGETGSAANPAPRAFLWSASAGVTYLPPAPAGASSPDLKPRGLNAASTVVGYYLTINGQRAFVWDSVRGVRDLNTLASHIPAGFTLRRAWRINDQGWIVGDGQGGGGFTKAFVLRPIGATCYANCDGSTTPPVLNVNDFTCFLNAFAAGDSYANCDGSTTPPVLNVNDFVCFQTRYAAGCP